MASGGGGRGGKEGNSRFKEVPSVRGHSEVRILGLMDVVQRKQQLAG